MMVVPVIDDELPGIRKMKERPADGPRHQHHDSSHEHQRMAYPVRGARGESAEPEADRVCPDDLLARLGKV
jgi:hypothetical protein